MDVSIVEAYEGENLEAVRRLFAEYERSLGFQDFAQELAELPGEYEPPDGRLFLALAKTPAAGCVGLKRFNESACEMKRLYVRPAFRRKRLGRALSSAVIEEAVKAGYKRMLPDTVPSMVEAISLYKSLGFKEREPY